MVDQHERSSFHGRTQSSLYRFKSNDGTFQRFKYYSYKRRKPIGIAVSVVLLLTVVLSVVLVIVLTKSGKSTSKPKVNNPTAQIVTFLFNVGSKSATSRFSRSLFASDSENEGKTVLKKAINGLAQNITGGTLVVQLIPYADKVVQGKLRDNLDNVENILKEIDQIFNEANADKSNPSQFDAVNYYVNTTEGLKASVEFAMFASKTEKKNSSFIFMAPKENLYASKNVRIKDSHETGQLFHTIASKISKTFLVGLDNNKNMGADYGLDSNDITVLPDGVNQIDKIVDDIKNNKPIVVTTTTVQTRTTKAKRITQSTPLAMTQSTTTVKTTITTELPSTDDFTDQTDQTDVSSSTTLPGFEAEMQEWNPDNFI